MDLVASFCVYVGEKPVAHNVGLDPPGEGELALLIDKVDKACFRVLNTSARLLDGESVGFLLGFSSSQIGRHRKGENLDSRLEGIYGLSRVTLAQTWWRCWDFALVERVSKREDAAITADLGSVSHVRLG